MQVHELWKMPIFYPPLLQSYSILSYFIFSQIRPSRKIFTFPVRDIIYGSPEPDFIIVHETMIKATGKLCT